MEQNLKKSNTYKAFVKSKFLSTKHKSYFYAYDEIFEKFRGKKITFVEIGVLNGGSLFMWREYFGPQARIIGVEFNPDAKKWKKHGFEIFIGDQSSGKFWDDFFSKVGMVDIILDDGGHTNCQQIVSCIACMPYINNGGMFVTEDTHTSYMFKFGNPSKYSFISWAKSIVDNINSRCINTLDSSKNYKKYIHSIRFFESIVVCYINSDKCINSHPINNQGLTSNAADFRYKGTFLDRIMLKSKLIFWITNKLKNLSLKKYF